MKILFDLLPVILFFVGFKFYGIFTATAIAIATTIGMIIYSKLRHNQVDRMLLVNGAIISVLGGFTLLLHDKTYIMWKPTALYWLVAAVLLVSDHLFQKNLIRKMMESVLQPPERTWRKLNYAWVIFFIVLGLVNLYVAFHYDEDTWVNFKLFGTTSMIFLFVIAQTVILKNYLVEPEEAEK